MLKKSTYLGRDEQSAYVSAVKGWIKREIKHKKMNTDWEYERDFQNRTDELRERSFQRHLKLGL